MKKLICIGLITVLFSQQKIIFTKNREIHSMDINGKNVNQLTNYKVPGHVPVSLRASVSDDNTISYIYDPNKHGWMSTYTMNIDGSNKTRISTEPTSKDGSTWNTDISPDGKHFVFFSMRTNNWEIYIMNRDGSNIKNISNSAIDEGIPKFFSNTQVIYPIHNNDDTDIIITDLNGANKETLITLKGKIKYLQTYQQRLLIYHVNSKLFVIDLMTKKESLITDKVGKYSMVNFSPDGQKIVFCDTNGFVSIIDINGKNFKKLIKGSDPVWTN